MLHCQSSQRKRSPAVEMLHMVIDGVIIGLRAASGAWVAVIFSALLTLAVLSTLSAHELMLHSIVFAKYSSLRYDRIHGSSYRYIRRGEVVVCFVIMRLKYSVPCWMLRYRICN